MLIRATATLGQNLLFKDTTVLQICEESSKLYLYQSVASVVSLLYICCTQVIFLTVSFARNVLHQRKGSFITFVRRICCKNCHERQRRSRSLSVVSPFLYQGATSSPARPDLAEIHSDAVIFREDFEATSSLNSELW